jgi:hypothetical protein
MVAHLVRNYLPSNGIRRFINVSGLPKWVQPPPPFTKSEVLIKLSRIPSAVENGIRRFINVSGLPGGGGAEITKF